MPNLLINRLEAYTLRLGSFLMEFQITHQEELVECDEPPNSLSHCHEIESDADRHNGFSPPLPLNGGNS
jgi:hypothetical protein